MSYVPGFINDLYISYAHMDNMSVGDEPGWIDLFHRSLEVRLAQLLGRRDALTIWRDPKIAGNDSFGSKVVDVLHGTAILVSVLSPRYLHSEWCLKELQEFVARSAGPLIVDNYSRIFKVLVSPVPFAAQPTHLSQTLGYEFYATDPATGRIKEFRQPFGRDIDIRFWERLNDLAHDIVKLLHALRERTLLQPKVETEPERAQPEMQPFQIIQPGTVGRALRVFLCHASNDKPRVRSLYKLLVEKGVDAWLDEEKLLPGQRWEREIPKAVRGSDAVVVCLSKSSINKTGYIQKEIRQALDFAEEHPEEAIFLIPAKFEECEIPERLSKWHWVNLFEERGTPQLLRALEARTSQLNVSAEINL